MDNCSEMLTKSTDNFQQMPKLHLHFYLSGFNGKCCVDSKDGSKK